MYPLEGSERDRIGRVKGGRIARYVEFAHDDPVGKAGAGSGGRTGRPAFSATTESVSGTNSGFRHCRQLPADEIADRGIVPVAHLQEGQRGVGVAGGAGA